MYLQPPCGYINGGNVYEFFLSSVVKPSQYTLSTSRVMYRSVRPMWMIIKNRKFENIFYFQPTAPPSP